MPGHRNPLLVRARRVPFAHRCGLGDRQDRTPLRRTSAEAIRQIRLSVRTLVATLSPEERKHARSWAEGGGCVGAVAAPHRGEPCGFSLSHHSAWLEWTVHPYYAFHTPETRQLPLLPR
ncbi:hypothetical protein [Streptomyces sp. S4.7]|uniref:hypothetical protein n=1 Tax=Streptomyces sp. S4.7 TaxID=2705439 RepID=UPI0013DAD811|nr:hypothetical protein [Streptomyces sp. S4.7]